MDPFLRAVNKTLKSFQDWILWPAKNKDCHYLISESEMDGTNSLCKVKPLKTLADILNWRPDQFQIVKSYIRFSPLCNNHCPHEEKILLCHDFKGNYLTDSYHAPNVTSASECYALGELWHSISCFCYFSHYLLTIPPVAWINQAHARGITVIGTFITEWDAGSVLCRLMLADENIWKRVAEQMAAIAAAYGFEGYLINIENTLPKKLMAVMLEFVRFLRCELRRVVGKHALVLWYDAVTLHGQLAWQNALTDDNACFLDECDGIFLNYSWKESGLHDTVAACCERRGSVRPLSDIFVGVDVFGRGMLGGGGFMTNAACEAIRRVDSRFSIALFAPGWVMEANDTTKFHENQIRFHRECVLPYAKVKQTSTPQVVDDAGIFLPLSPWTGLYDTVYINGRRRKRFCTVDIENHDELVIADLSQESLQPFGFNALPACLKSDKASRWSYDAGFTGNGSLCIPPLPADFADAASRGSGMSAPGDDLRVLHHLCLLKSNISLADHCNDHADSFVFLSVKYKCDMQNLRLLPIVVERSTTADSDKVDTVFIVGRLGEADAARLSAFVFRIFHTKTVRFTVPVLEDDRMLDQVSCWRSRSVEIHEHFAVSSAYDIFLITYEVSSEATRGPLYLQDCFLQRRYQSALPVGNVQRLVATQLHPPQIVGHELLHFEVFEVPFAKTVFRATRLNAVIGWKISGSVEKLPCDARFLVQVRIKCGNAACVYSSLKTEHEACKQDDVGVDDGQFVPFALTYHLMVQLNDIPVSCSTAEYKTSHGVEVEVVPFLLRQGSLCIPDEESYRIKLL